MPSATRRIADTMTGASFTGASDLLQSDDQLLTDSAAGDQRAFAILMRRHARPIRALAQRLLGNPEDAEDVAQEVALKVWRNAAAWRSEGSASFATWLHRVVVNASLDRRRRVVHAPMEDACDITDGTPPAWETVLADQRRRFLRRAMAELPPRQGAALRLYYLEQLSAAEVACRLGLSLPACQAVLARGKGNLRRALRRAGLAGPHDAL